MNTDALVSIIIPVYNVEKYISRCLDSVVSQTYKNLEIILIDDGSVDESGKICDEYAKKDGRITTYHRENRGQASARNLGIEQFSGEYVCFIDSDDFVRKDYIEFMLGLLLEEKCDIVQCEYAEGGLNSFPNVSSRGNRIILSGEEASCDLRFTVSLWNKLYKRDIVKNCVIPEKRKGEDEGIYYLFAYKAKTVCLCDEVLYYYYMSDNSVMRNSKKINLDFVDIFNERISFFEKEKKPRLVIKSKQKYAVTILLVFAKNDFGKKDKNVRETLLNEYKKIKNDISKNSDVGLPYRMAFRLFGICPDLCSILLYPKVKK